MLKNYLLITLRTLRKQAGYAAINVSGLAVGLACCLIIFLFVRHEFSYDRHHEKAERIYRIGFDARIGDASFHAAVSPTLMAETLLRDFPEVEQTTRLFAFSGNVSVRHEDRRFVEKGFLFADSTIFDVFTFPFVQGDSRKALTEPYTVVLTEATAEKYFGAGDPVGQTLAINDDDYRVTGVIEGVPDASHFHFDMLGSMESNQGGLSNTTWVSNNFYTYLVLPPGYDAQVFEDKLSELVENYVGPVAQEIFGASYEEFMAASGFRYFIQPLTDIHLHSDLDYEIEPNGNIAYVYALVAIAVLILLIACINFMNLATARSAGRAREVGIRKSLGSERGQLIRQFLFEAICMSTLALVLALALVQFVLPLFNHLADTSLNNAFLSEPFLLIVLLVLALIVGVLAGSYPAFFLSSFRPAQVLKGKVQQGASGTLLRNGLVVFQFAISIALMVCTGVVFNQIRYVQDKNLGFDEERVVVLERAGVLGEQNDAFRQQLLLLPAVEQVSFAAHLPGRLVGDNAYHREGASTEELESLRAMFADHDFVETLGMRLVAGRSFSRDRAADSAAVILNQAAVQRLGWTEDPVGKVITQPALTGEEPDYYTVIGVVENFHFESLHEQIDPVIIHLSDFIRYATVRIAPGDLPNTLASIEQTWNAFIPEAPFEYAFLDQDFDAMYAADRQTGRLFTAFALLAIFIACLGLFGLASYLIQQRTKEVGVRKVLGATVPGIVGLLSKDFARLVLVANLIAWPMAYFAMRAWLANFAYHVEMGVGLFVLAAGMALAIALLTVSYQSIRAATADPVKSLRYE